MKIVTALSGGVDSGTCALLLLREGFEVIGLTFEMFPPAEPDSSPSSGAKRLCASLGIDHHTLDESESFRRNVTEQFVAGYLRAQTPNPCVLCNRAIKFPAMFSFADSFGAPLCSTGHYARTVREGDTVLLKKAADETKDQTYVLWNLTQEMLCRLKFPLGGFTKSQIREIAAEAGLECAASKDSQDICFIPDGDYAAYIERCSGFVPPCGSYISSDGSVLGSHPGLHRVTLGQSRGLGIALGERMYVTGKDAARNTVTLGSDGELYKKRVTAREINILIPGALDAPERLSAKVRYGRREDTGVALRTGKDEIVFTFDEAVRAPCPGQSLVIYDGDTVVAGGIIEKAE